MTDAERAIFLLHTCPQLLTSEIHALLDHCAQIGIAPHALRPEHLLSFGFSLKKVSAVMNHMRTFSINESLAQLAQTGVRPISLFDSEYPALLKAIHDPPHFLFAKGYLRNDIPLIAVVGTRHPTPYGVSCTRTMTSALSASGFGIVSGLAHGIDSAAHQEALRVGGYTVAVIAHGHARSTPREHALCEHILEGGGAVMSEHLPFVRAQKHFFPIRNRIIAGMARATLVTEATRRSGTLITASCAIRENRDVFAVPGLITNPQTEGPHTLIAEGAACIHSPQALRDALGVTAAPTQAALPLLCEDAIRVLKLLHASPQHIDDLLDITKLSLQTLIGYLHELQSQNLAEERPGNIFAARTQL